MYEQQQSSHHSSHAGSRELLTIYDVHLALLGYGGQCLIGRVLHTVRWHFERYFRRWCRSCSVRRTFRSTRRGCRRERYRRRWSRIMERVIRRRGHGATQHIINQHVHRPRSNRCLEYVRNFPLGQLYCCFAAWAAPAGAGPVTWPCRVGPQRAVQLRWAMPARPLKWAKGRQLRSTAWLWSRCRTAVL